LSGYFTSDNVAPVSPAIMAAIHAANALPAPSYGADPLTERLRSVASQVFEADLAIYPVATGTAANALALSQLAPPYGAVYCHEAAHIATDECAAPEFFTGGAKMLGLPSPDGKIGPSALGAAVAQAQSLGVHHVLPAALSVSQATEWGTVYTLAELGALAEVARQFRLPVHMDGARFANALVHLGCAPAALTWKSGVDVLSLGATKNGALCAEAVVFFNPALAEQFERRRKRAGHLWSKLRFLSAQLLAYFEDDLWLGNARHANAMASKLAQGLAQIEGARLLQSVDANEVFVALPETLTVALEHAGFRFYRWPSSGAPGVPIRLVTSYATLEAEVEDFLRAAVRLSGSR
jgi:threonine aldolase